MQERKTALKAMESQELNRQGSLPERGLISAAAPKQLGPPTNGALCWPPQSLVGRLMGSGSSIVRSDWSHYAGELGHCD